MKRFLLATIGIVVASSAALADGMSLAGSLWQCTRASDGSQLIITFYPGGGVGGGEHENGEVSPYIFDASRTKPGQWPGRWKQNGRSFTWTFPDQNIRIKGQLSRDTTSGRLSGTEISGGHTSAIACTALSKLPRIGEGLVIPRNGRFIDLDGDEGELKVPAGISLREQEPR